MSKSKFIVVDHDAKRAGKHQDIRFRQPTGNNWDSFAVKKGVPLNPGTKVLAVKTHDHSKKEALFIGTIPEGEYGAGTLKKFDDGSCEIIKHSPAHIVVDFKGKKIKGVYHFISTGVIDRKYAQPKFLLFKGKIKK